MPQLYPLKVEQKGHNFVANGVSDIPLKLPIDEKNKLFSKNYYAKLKNKTMSIPVDYKEDIMRRSPEKPKLPFVSTSRKSQIEEIKERELKQAKRNRLSYYINQKFACKFGSSHKHSIAASVEDFLDDNENTNIDVNDLRLLDSIISDSILQRRDDVDFSSSLNVSDGTNKSALSGSGYKGLTQSMSHLPLGSDLKILKQHRSLYKEEKIRNGYQNTEDVQTRRLGQSQSEASLDKDIAKLKEIEHYRTAEYMNESLKILTFDELVTKKAAQDRKNDVFKKQMVRERSRAAARDMSQECKTEQYSDIKSNMTVYERVKEDSDYRLHKRNLAPGPYKLTRNVVEDRHLEQKIQQLNDVEFNTQSLRNALRGSGDLGSVGYVDPVAAEYKLSQKTFKESVIRKQEEHRREMQREAADRQKMFSEFNKTDMAKGNNGKNPSKIGNTMTTVENYSLRKTM